MKEQNNQEVFHPCIRICLECATQCYSTANECLKETKAPLPLKCIKFTRECAEICLSTARILAQRNSHIKDVCIVCTEYCLRAAEECETHAELDYCRKTSETCRKCAEECETLSRTYSSRS